jgi:hypothetical protein
MVPASHIIRSDIDGIPVSELTSTISKLVLLQSRRWLIEKQSSFRLSHFLIQRGSYLDTSPRSLRADLENASYPVWIRRMAGYGGACPAGAGTPISAAQLRQRMK